MINWFLHVTGIDAPGSRWYNFWSGTGSDLGEFGIVIAIYRSRNCQVHGCWRIGLRRTDGGHVVCHKHHPDGKLTHGAVIDAHGAAIDRDAAAR